MTMTLPKGITLEILRSNWDIASREYRPAFKRMLLLDSTDRGRLWEALRARGFPPYQILPDTNHVAWVKQNLLASIYSVGKAANLLPTTEEDQQVVMDLNILLDHYWTRGRVGKYQRQAGERAALTNIGITQIGWDATLEGGVGDYAYKGGPVCKNIDPSRFMRDPYAEDLESSAYCMTWDVVHKNVLRLNPLYKESLPKYEASQATLNSVPGVPVDKRTDGPGKAQAQTQKDNYKVIVHWVRYENKIAEIHTIDNEFLLYVKEDIQPSTFPFAILYCNDPAGDLIGTSVPASIYANSVAYNLFNSILLTAEYKNQNPPSFIQANSGLNVPAFIKHANDANYAFIVSGNASDTVHYLKYPQPGPTAAQLIQKLPMDIMSTSGVDGRYTGRDTGSILTTGGIEAMLDQATLIDAPKIANYEDYTLRLTKLFISNLCKFAPKRKYFVKDPNSSAFKVVEINFPKLKDDDIFAYEINISSVLPKNKARLAQTANVIVEKQLQYAQTGQQVDLITPEEWLQCQDLPNKERMMERMGLQRSHEYTERVSEILFTFAQLTKAGMPAEEAIAQTAQFMQQKDTPAAMQTPQDVMPDLEAPMPEMQQAINNPLQGLM